MRIVFFAVVLSVVACTATFAVAQVSCKLTYANVYACLGNPLAVAGSGGQGGTAVPPAGSGGTSAGTSAGTGGAGSGAAGTAAGSGGSGSAGTGGHAAHGGLPVAFPLPTYPAGSKTFDVARTGEMPQRDAGGIGAARTRCNVSHVNFDDSIVYPNRSGAAHAHQYAGNDKSTAFGLGTDAGSTCRGGAANLSSYWWPALLDANGKVYSPSIIDVYYKQSHYDVDGVVTPPPKGLKIVAGNMNARAESPQNRFYYNWTCDGQGGANYGGVPTCAAPIMNVYFPQCSDGRLDSPDHKSHMSYPVNGSCPSTHPTLLPSISYHIYYARVAPGARLSSDGATGAAGYSLHADILVNWDEEIMRTMVNRCVNTGLSCGSHMVGDGRVLQ